MSYRRSARRGAVIGLGVGAAVALALLALGRFGSGEALEAVMYLALPISVPAGLAFVALGIGGAATTWIPFIALAIPLNGALWGAVIGVVIRATQALGRPTRPSA